MKYFAALALLMAVAASATSPPPATPAPTKAGGKGDPMLTGFDGRTFEFIGKAGSIYNVISEKTHQLSMKLKEGKLWDHEGSYIEALALQHLDHSVEMVLEGDSVKVTLDGKDIVMGKDESEVEHIMGLANGELQLLWQLHRAEHGNTVELTTELFNIIAWVTPAGTRDEGGKIQPAYLNFDVSLLASPAHNALHGLIGETFNKATNEVDDFKFHGVEAEYEMASFFDAAHPQSLYGKSVKVSHARKLIESGRTLSFPAKASLVQRK